MSEQPEALSLADRLVVHLFSLDAEFCDLNRDAAAELRRLHALCEEMGEALDNAAEVLHGCVIPAGGLDDAKSLSAAQSEVASTIAKWKESK